MNIVALNLGQPEKWLSSVLSKEYFTANLIVSNCYTKWQDIEGEEKRSSSCHLFLLFHHCFGGKLAGQAYIFRVKRHPQPL